MNTHSDQYYCCDYCGTEIKRDGDDRIFVADNYDLGPDWVFCSLECFVEFHHLRTYEHAHNFFKSLKVKKEST